MILCQERVNEIELYGSYIRRPFVYRDWLFISNKKLYGTQPESPCRVLVSWLSLFKSKVFCVSVSASLFIHFSSSPSAASPSPSGSRENLQFWMATSMYSFPLDGVMKSVTISSVSYAVLMRSEWNPDLAGPPPSLGPPSICPRVYLVCMTRFEISAAYYTGFIFSSSSGKYFTGIPNQNKTGSRWCFFACLTHHRSW